MKLHGQEHAGRRAPEVRAAWRPGETFHDKSVRRPRHRGGGRAGRRISCSPIAAVRRALRDGRPARRHHRDRRGGRELGGRPGRAARRATGSWRSTASRSPASSRCSATSSHAPASRSRSPICRGTARDSRITAAPERAGRGGWHGRRARHRGRRRRGSSGSIPSRRWSGRRGADRGRHLADACRASADDRRRARHRGSRRAAPHRRDLGPGGRARHRAAGQPSWRCCRSTSA